LCGAKVHQKMRIHTIDTGFFSTDGGAMFGILPQRIWSRKYAVEADNRCPMTMRVVYADFGLRKVLFDTGIGSAHVSGMDYYRFHDLKLLSQELETLGCKTEDISDVVLSHLHFDHCGGMVCPDSDGKQIPAFPNAIHWVGKRQYEAALNPSAWEQDSFAPEVVDIIARAGLFQFVEADQELFPGLRVELYQGHTDDQLVSWIQTNPEESPQEAKPVVVPGDVIPTKLHLNSLCIAAVDNSALVAMDEKARLMKKLRQKASSVIFYHDVTTTSETFSSGKI
jgi:glyoxylase-like metal-dependent hydrolase (beta-lactamase superfamily II)